MIVSNIYTTDNGQSYHIDFDQTKDNINFTTLKTVKFLKYDDLLRLKDRIEKIINVQGFNAPQSRPPETRNTYKYKATELKKWDVSSDS